MPPVPKREAERRRRNKVPAVERVQAGGRVEQPPIRGDISVRARCWYESLAESGQAGFYEPSDWQFALLAAEALDEYLRKPSAAQLAAVNSMMSGLLVTEADRRRSRLEVDRTVDVEAEASEVAVMERYRRAAGG